MGNSYLTNKAYWQKQISGIKPFEVTRNEFANVLQKYLPVDPGFTCTEIGAYPGINLCYMAKTFKYKPTAIEFRDDVNDIINLFEFNGITELEVINTDFFQLTGLQFDVVTSFGFIEHFIDYETVIKRHVEMVKPNGYLVLSVPYLWGLQGFLRRLILKKDAMVELHETHNIQIMKLSKVIQSLKNNGLQILCGEYVMGCRFWIPSDSPRIKPEMRWLANILAKLDKTILPKIPSAFLYSPMFLCIARKI